MNTSPLLIRKGGITRGAFPWWHMQQENVQKSLLVIPEETDVLDLVDDYKALFRLPASWKTPPALGVSGFSIDNEPEQGWALHNWLFGKDQVLIVSLEGLSQLVDIPQELRRKTYPIKPGITIRRRKFEDILGEAGYMRNDRAEQVGEYAVRGDVVDIWMPNRTQPVRINWNMDTVESLRPIDLYSQRSEGFETEALIYPVQLGKACPLSEIVSEDVAIVIFQNQIGKFELPQNWDGRKMVYVIPQAEGEATDDFGPPPSFSGHIPHLKKQLMEWHDQDWEVAIFCHNRGERDRLEELLDDPYSTIKGKALPWFPKMIVGDLEHGFIHPLARRAVLTNSEIFGRYRKRYRLPKFEGGETVSSLMDIKPYDYLVHEKHGIGRYVGLKPIKVEDIISEYMTLEYKGGDKLYVPIFELQQVQKYLGAEGRRPTLASLDSPAWEKTKQKVKEDVVKLAADLLKKAAKRTIRPGFAFPVKSHLEEEFAQSFMYELTPDQKKTWEEVEMDMSLPKAMDRLICGDVGFGKTEIAMRAALKCALAGKQVAFLCPTTLLAEQHFRNFTERMAEYPVTLKLLSRFQTKKEQKEVIDGVGKGGVDIVIGTHRLLSSDVHFKDVRLIIIDEEHRFGVKQKNKLLHLRESADVISLTATPIPRTLAASLGGIKDLSVIESAPQGRLPIMTHVGVFDEDMMVKAVQNELDRGGQVFYVHNRVKTLLARKAWLESVLPEVRIGMGHGQMKEHELENTMHQFLHRKVDILLATTIIESGLDIPSVNTLIVEEADEMGLAQLYQLRGRVGRSRARAYCYLFHSVGGMTTDAQKRLKALKEFTALGSGFRLAMRDMEIRGAGNLLGHQQHGNMAAVGIETYSALLNEEIQKMKGEVVEDSKGPLLEVSISSYIPEDYMPSEPERIQTYKRILSSNEGELKNLKEELVDRCGPLPPPAQTLFDAAFLRLIVGRKGISEVHQGPDDLLIYFKPNLKLPDASFDVLIKLNGKELSLIQGPPMGVRMPLDSNEGPLDGLGRFLRIVFPS